MEMQWTELKFIIVGAFGLLLLVSGTRLYRFSIMAPGSMMGAYVGVLLSVGQENAIQLFAIGLGGVLGGVTMLLVEQLAISIVGALLGGGLVHYIGPMLDWGMVDSFGNTFWYWNIVGSFAGALAFPLIFPKIVPLWMSGIGAGCTAYALQRPEDWSLIAILTCFGTLLQIFFGGTQPDMSD